MIKSNSYQTYQQEYLTDIINNKLPSSIKGFLNDDEAVYCIKNMEITRELVIVQLLAEGIDRELFWYFKI